MKSQGFQRSWSALAMALGLFVAVVAGEGALAAQLTSGTITGTVKDQSGAVLPSATITATNTETGITRNTTSGTRGEYRLSALSAGSYDVQAEMAGFQIGVRKGVTLTVGGEPVLDFSLPVGNVTEQVTVTGEAPLVEATTSTVSGVVDQQQMRDIPLNARSFIELVPLQTGAVFAQAGTSDNPTWGFGKKLSVVGTRINANSFLLDGADINNVGGTAGNAAGTVAGVETVREFRVITNAYDAAYGRHTGAVISAITKSGTNDMHGSLFEFVRNDALDANLWEDNRSGSEKPAYVRNQFGGSIGGRIVRDKAFYFGSYEGLRDNKGVVQTYTVPGGLMRRDMASGTIAVNPVIKPYLDKYLALTPNVTCTTGCLSNAADRAQFPFDRPGSPAANANYTTARYQFPTETTTLDDFYTVKVDHHISDADSIFVRYNQDNGERNLTPDFTTTNALTNTNRFTTIEETRIFTPTLLAKTHFSYNRTRIGTIDNLNAGFEYPNGLTSFDGAGTPGRISNTLSSWGGGSTTPKDYVQNLFQFQEDMFYSKGSHSLKFGGQFERTQLNDTSGFHDGGTFAFSTLKEFLDRTVNEFDVTTPGSDNVRGSRQNLLGLYLQDDWSVRPGLTVNFGLRYEIISVPIEVNGKVSNIRNITEANVRVVTPATVDVGDPYFTNPSLKNFAPRAGFAWDPMGDGKMSIRAGAGIYHDQLLPGEWRSPLGRSAPFYAVSQPTNATLPTVCPGQTIDFPRMYFTQVNCLLSGQAQYDGFEWAVKQPTVYKWSFDIQREIFPGYTFEAGYSGTRSTHLLRSSIQLNSSPVTQINGLTFVQATGQTNTNFGRLRWRTSDGVSDYHGLRLQLTRRFSRGFQIQGSYTYSKALDDTSSFVGGGDFTGDSDRGGVRRAKEHGPTAFDVRNSLTTNLVYDLPGAALSGIAGEAFGGWSVSSIIRLNNGQPFSLGATRPRLGSTNLFNVGGSSLDLIPGGDQRKISGTSAGCLTRPGATTYAVQPGTKLGTPDQYYDPCQFSYPASYNLPSVVGGTNSTDAAFPAGVFIGNLGRNHMNAPGLVNVDFTLMKETKLSRLHEGASLEFRAEFFNLFNRPNFDQPSAGLFDRTGVRTPGAGAISGTLDSAPARQIQFAVRLAF
ncbi:MAG: TonB-dependent receptor [Acidobacteria bacterium]|nr:TonB-dependent receptor [Acidobacteriota bacterium]